jgi:hypothetical protein
MLYLLLTMGFLALIAHYFFYPSAFQRVYSFFKTSPTKYFSPMDLEMFRHIRSSREYVVVLEDHFAGNPLYLTLAIGQLLKEIWRDRDLDLLQRFIVNLQKSDIEPKIWKDSINGHKGLYSSDLGNWTEGEAIIQMI